MKSSANEDTGDHAVTEDSQASESEHGSDQDSEYSAGSDLEREKVYLVNNVIKSVNSTFKKAKEGVTELNETLSPDDLTAAQLNAILASFLVEKDEEYSMHCYGQGHQYFKAFGAEIPRYSYNQLKRSYGAAKGFHKHFSEALDNHADKVLYSLFRKEFMINVPPPIVTGIRRNQLDQLQRLKDSLRSRRLVVMAGVGVSLAIGAGRTEVLSWGGLLNSLRELLTQRSPGEEVVPDNDWNGMSAEVKAETLDEHVKARYPHLDYRQFVSQLMRDVSPSQTAALIPAIRNLNLPIATTNYDILLEWSMNRFEQNLSEASVRFLPNFHHEFVYHVHGVWYDSNSIVLSDGDYNRTQYEFEYAVGKLLFDSAPANQHRSLLFIGCKDGMVDKHFSTLYTDPRFAHLTHFTLLKEADVQYLLDTSPAFNAAVEARRLVPIIYGTQSSDLPAFLLELMR